MHDAMTRAPRLAFPIAAIVGQVKTKPVLSLCAADPGIGSVRVFGDWGISNSTTVPARAALLPPMSVVTGCRYAGDPAQPGHWYDECRVRDPIMHLTPVPIVNIPLGITEDRVVGAGSGARTEKTPAEFAA